MKSSNQSSVRPRLAALAVVAFLVAGCATVQPTPAVTPTAAVTTPTVTPTATMSTSAPSTATPSPTPSADTSVVLAGNGLAGYRFGAPEETVEAVVRERLGDPVEVSEGVACELNTSSPWSRTLSYGGLWVQFLAKSPSKSAPRTLQAWGFMLAQKKKFAPPLKMADDVPLNLTFAQLKAKYPKGKLTSEPLGEEPVKIFTLPSKVRFIGYERHPDMVSAGVITFCE